jgi:hypothetical protein
VFGADPNPVIEAAGHIPISPVTIVGPVLLTEGVAPRIPKLQAAPKAMTGGGVPHAEGLVNVHTLLAASALPNVSCAPVVIVALKRVPGARLPEGVKVATMVAAMYVTVPDTLAPPAVKVNVFAPAEVLIVAGFIALLNVAVIMGALLGQTRVPFGVTESTVGAAVGEVGPPPTSGSPHPAITTANRNAGIQILLTFNLRISFSSSPS